MLTDNALHSMDLPIPAIVKALRRESATGWEVRELSIRRTPCVPACPPGSEGSSADPVLVKADSPTRHRRYDGCRLEHWCVTLLLIGSPGASCAKRPSACTGWGQRCRMEAADGMQPAHLVPFGMRLRTQYPDALLMTV